jgi:hypothetical protein
MIIIRKNNGFIDTDWFHKDTWSGRYLHFSSNHPIQYKISVIYGITDRAIKLSEIRFRQKNLNIVRKTLLENGYPMQLINECISKKIHQFFNTFGTENSTQKPKFIKTFSIPYVKGITEKIQMRFRSENIRLVAKPFGTNIGNIRPYKDQLPLLKKVMWVI